MVIIFNYTTKTSTWKLAKLAYFGFFLTVCNFFFLVVNFLLSLFFKYKQNSLYTNSSNFSEQNERAMKRR